MFMGWGIQQFEGCLRRLNSKRFSFAFTLAEVLITLGIIGVVAALTIPALVTYNQQKGWEKSAVVFERKLEEALRIMNTQQVLTGYKTTEDFVDELSKHMKITKVCQNDDILSCFEDKIYWGSNEVETDIEPIKTTIQIGLYDWNMKLVGVNFINGINAIIAYNPNCKQDPYSNEVDVLQCVAVLYDVSGYQLPNATGKDLNALNISSIDGSCAFAVGSGCATTPMKAPSGISISECEKLVEKGLIHNCPREGDRYAAAVKYCDDLGKKLPSINDLKGLAKDLYGTNVNSGWNSGLTLDTKKWNLYGFNKLGAGCNDACIWSDTEDTSNPANSYYMQFYTYATYWHSHNGRGAPYDFFCVDK